MAKTIGIDLGTSNSAASILEGGKPVIIPSAEGMTLGGKAFPSVIAFTKDGQLLVGEPARRQAIANTEGTILANKRKMGTDHRYRIYGKEYTPQQISGLLLQKIKRDAEAFLGTSVEKAVITVPAYFNDNQRQATKDAGQIAGLEVVRIVNEPTAACLAYGLDKQGKKEKILVFDLGGGTLDVTLMDFGEGVFEVISTSGDTQLGGTDMDNALVDFITDEFRKQNGIDLKTDPQAVQRVREAAEKAKIELSSTMETEINLPFVVGPPAVSEAKHLVMRMTRAKVEAIIKPIVDRCRRPLEQALSDAKMSANDVGRIILVGGPTRMPIIQKFVEDAVGRKVERGVDPMECVAMGAAVQAGVLEGSVKDVLLLDVTPLSLGIETLGGVFTTLIPRNTTIPTKKGQIFSTASDSQPAVTVAVYQGERPMAHDNVHLGQFDLVGIPPAPRGVPQIEVTFDIDANGIMHVTAKDLGTAKEQSLRITAPHKMDKSEVERLQKDAEKFAEEDKKRKEEAEATNELDGLVYATERSLKDYGDKITQDDRLAVDRALSDAKEALKSKDVVRIKKSKDDLITAAHKLAEVVYKAAAAKGQQGQGGPGGPGGAGGPGGSSSAGGPDSSGPGPTPGGSVEGEVVDNPENPSGKQG